MAARLLARLPGRLLARHGARTGQSARCSSTPSSSPLAKPRELLESASEFLEERPIAANSMISGVLCAVGDALAQYIEVRFGPPAERKDESPRYDWLRTARMTIYGSVICGPLLAVWYRSLAQITEALQVQYAPVLSGRLFDALASRAPALDRVFSMLHVEKEAAVHPMKILSAKVLADALLFQAPFLNLYFAFMGALEGLGPMQIYEHTRDNFHRAWALGFVVWAPVQMINLYFVPFTMQPTVVAMVNIGWKSTLSILNAQREAQEHPESAMSQLAAAEAERDELRLEVRSLRRELRLMHTFSPPDEDDGG